MLEQRNKNAYVTAIFIKLVNIYSIERSNCSRDTGCI